jgi:hypothetical protein
VDTSAVRGAKLIGGQSDFIPTASRQEPKRVFVGERVKSQRLDPLLVAGSQPSFYRVGQCKMERGGIIEVVGELTVREM